MVRRMHRRKRVALASETIRLLTGDELQLVAAGADAPAVSQSSTAFSCQSTKFPTC